MSNIHVRKYLSLLFAVGLTTITGCLGLGDNSSDSPTQNNDQVNQSDDRIIQDNVDISIQQSKITVNRMDTEFIFIEDLSSERESLRVSSVEEPIQLQPGFYRITSGSGIQGVGDNNTHQSFHAIVQVGEVTTTIDTWDSQSFRTTENVKTGGGTLKQNELSQPMRAVFKTDLSDTTEPIGGYKVVTGEDNPTPITLRFSQVGVTEEAIVSIPSLQSNPGNNSFPTPNRRPVEIFGATFPSTFDPSEPFFVEVYGSTNEISCLERIEFVSGNNITVLKQ